MIKIQMKQLLTLTILTSVTVGMLTGMPNKALAQNTPPTIDKAHAETSFWDLAYLDKPYIETSPMAMRDGIEVGHLSTMSEKGNDKTSIKREQMILKFAQEIADSKHGKIDSLLISHQNKLVFESYYLRGRVDLPHMQASSTKSYLSLAVGRAIQMGYLSMSDLSKPLVSFLKDIDLSKAAKGVEKITLHKAMSMQSGVKISREQVKELNKNVEAMKGQKQIQSYFENIPDINSASQVFNYNAADPRMVMQVLDAVVPGTAKNFIEKELLHKMGITNFKWREDISGLLLGPYGSSMTSRDMIKWGTLVANKGKYNGEQLVSEVFLEKATNAVVHPNSEQAFFIGDNLSNPGYGYYFWQADMKFAGKSYYSQSAQGGGGQYIIMIDELDLIVVFTAHERDDKTMKITADNVLPAFVN